VKILIDGDSCCNRKGIAEKVAKYYHIPCKIFLGPACDITSSYSEIHYVSEGSDMADFAIINDMERGDVVITNDSGLASMVLAKGGHPVNTRGYEYTESIINSFLNKRYARDRYSKATGRKLKTDHYLRPYITYENFFTLINRIVRKEIAH